MSGLEGLLTGQTLVKRYRVQEVIGRGGFAAVYRADDERLGRPVAVKVITISTPDPGAATRHRERFEREARAAASLPQHPNVVTVYDFGVDPTLGLDFLVMELLHGEDLATRLRHEGRLPQDLSLRILRDAAAGIAVGHRAGIVHRDVKPGNIFLARGEGTGGMRVCILDFGIARVLTDDQTLTGVPGEGTPLSPAYASPEQTRGERDLTPASDVFSLGVVAYQLLTGEKPFAASRSLDPAQWQPRRAMRDLNPDVPVWLEGIVFRALAYAPENRYTDAEDFAAALATAETGDETLLAPVAAPGPAPVSGPGGLEPDRTLYQPQEAPAQQSGEERPVYRDSRDRHNRSAVGPLVFLLLLLAGGAAGWWFLSGGGSPRPDPSATADLETITDDLDRSSEPDEGDETVETPSVEDVPAEPGLPFPTAPTGELPPLDTATAGFPPDTGAGEIGDPTQPGETLPAENPRAAPPEATRPPPRVIGIPVDSLRRQETPAPEDGPPAPSQAPG